MPYWSFVFWGLVLGFSPVLSPFLIQFSPVLDFLFGSARFLPVNQDWSGFSIVFNAISPVLSPFSVLVLISPVFVSVSVDFGGFWGLVSPTKKHGHKSAEEPDF